MANIQKKYRFWVVLLVGLGLSGTLQAQESMTKPLTLFKFFPLPLVTNAMSFGIERMNATQTRSTGISLGVRYRRVEEMQFDYRSPSSQGIANYNQWQGAFVHLERRFYVPVFQKLEKGTWLDARGSSGVYWAPSVLVDYSINEFDKSGFESYTTNSSGQPVVSTYTNRGTVNLFSIKPSVVLGVQYTLFEHLYFDMSLGAGLRWLSENKNIIGAASPQGYYTSSLEGPADDLLYRAGVRVSGQVAIGVKW